ncbi:MAG: F0F1 ATP synthase subunit B [Bacteroidia bacterium]|nr:F0F1 ATP synthase subunit B [Bacteroidia bacterium]
MILVPQLGLFFWSLVVFLIFFFILRKFAWKPIISMLKEREESISQSLQQAEKAREEMAKLQADNEKLLNDARHEREKMLKEASQVRDEIIAKAREEASSAAAKEMEKAKVQIESEKMAALITVKNEAGMMALQIAEKILRRELANGAEKEALAKKLVSELNNN